ncbi:MAG: protein kinase, partial [Actinobacteria bacterium]|nr:protein kinase [Actinomycetota bacterium]
MSVRKSSDGVVGSELAGYLVEALIGRGGMGAVYRAEEQSLGRKVALKVIASELAEDHRFRERFLRESRIAASLDHPHIVPIFQAGDEDGVLFLAMRYVEGIDLAKLVSREGALEPARAISLLEQVAEALDAAHEKGLVHRDVKPSNVLIAVAAGKEHCYLADFGLTKRTGSLSGVSAPGDVVGTLEYVAPEQITGDDVDARADVYSLACVLYECLTGQPPFPRATDVALLWAHVHEEPRRPSEARPELPKEVDGVLARALSKEPGRRYDSAGELVASAHTALGLVEMEPAPRARRRRTLPVVAALGALAAAALAFALLRDPGGGLSAVSPNSVGVIDPVTNELVAEVPVGIDPESIVAGAGAVWVANVADETVTRIDPVTRERGRTIDVGGYPSDLVVGGGAVWVALGALAELTRINQEQNVATSPTPALGKGVPCGAPRASIAIGAGAVWFACEAPELGRIDIRTSVARRVGLEAGLLTSLSAVLPQFADAAFGLESLWIVNRAGNSVIELDPTTIQRQREITVGKAPSAIAVGDGTLWVANFEDDTVTRITVTGRGQTVETDDFEVGDGPVDVAVGEGGVWVASSLDRTVTRLDGAMGEVVARIELGNEPQRLAAGAGSVWVSVRAPE